ncbi:MAG: hypothetical protein U0452_11995 [Anaerolineae bacterium]
MRTNCWVMVLPPLLPLASPTYCRKARIVASGSKPGLVKNVVFDGDRGADQVLRELAVGDAGVLSFVK